MKIQYVWKSEPQSDLTTTKKMLPRKTAYQHQIISTLKVSILKVIIIEQLNQTNLDESTLPK